MSTEHHLTAATLIAAGYGWLPSVGVEFDELCFELRGDAYVADARIDGQEAVAYAERVDSTTLGCCTHAMVRIEVSRSHATCC